MRTERIKLKDWLSGNCQFKGCEHNADEGTCTYDDGEFIEDILELVDKNGVDGDVHFECVAIEIPNGVCEWCGSFLKRFVEYYPYGDTTVPFEYYECTNKNC